MNNPKNEVSKPYSKVICEATWDLYYERNWPLINLLPLSSIFTLQDLLCNISPYSKHELNFISREHGRGVAGGRGFFFLVSDCCILFFLVSAASSISSASVWGGNSQSLSDHADSSLDPVPTSPSSFQGRHHYSEPHADNRASTPLAQQPWLTCTVWGGETSYDIVAID